MIAKTPWTERTFNFDFPSSHFPFILERLRGIYPRMEYMTRGISGEKLSHKPGGKWSIKEHIGHLSDLEELHKTRITQFLNGEKTLVAADMSNAKTNEALHNNKSIDVLLKEFSDTRNQFIHTLEQVTDEQLIRTALHPRLQQQVRLADIAFFVAEHDDHHLTIIRELLTA